MKKLYSHTTGYSSLGLVDQDKMLDVIRVNKRIVDEFLRVKKEDRILVAGCGQGYEAAFIQQEFRISTIGVDLNIHPRCLTPGLPDLMLQKHNLSALGFAEDVFSLVYCYHTLEHVDNHVGVLTEFFRVLKPRGVLFIGFPNKNRIFSYLGTSQKASIAEKIAWNINDYKFRLQGKFENHLGAHAGFTEKEFLKDASNIFRTVIPSRSKYMFYKYPKFKKLLSYINKADMDELIFPSNYYICIKGWQENE